MLEPIQLHFGEIQKNFYRIWYDPAYQYYFGIDRRWTPANADDTDAGSDRVIHQFASVDPKTGKVIGYIGYILRLSTRGASDFGAINFYRDEYPTLFAKDLFTAIEDLFEKFGCRVMNFMEVEGNPIEKSYDRLVQKYGGRIVGYQRDQALAIDGKLCNAKLYEIHSDDYFRVKREMEKKGT